MASSNASSTNEKQAIKMDISEPASGKEKDNMANSNVFSTARKQEVKIDSDKYDLDKEKIVGMATSEMEYRVELFNRLVHTCFNKCSDKRYKEGELNIGENTCVDRCVAKYWQVNNIIGNVLAYGRRS